MRRRRSQGIQGFTLIEVLVVIVILAMLMTIALPLYLDAISKSERSTCRTNMQTIATAEQAYRARNFPTHNFTTNIGNLAIDLVAPPTCPTGGTYSVVISNGTQSANNGLSVPAGGIVIACSFADHGVYAPSIDSD